MTYEEYLVEREKLIDLAEKGKIPIRDIVSLTEGLICRVFQPLVDKNQTLVKEKITTLFRRLL